MDRERLINELRTKGLNTENGKLTVLEELGRGGNGVALLCSGETIGEIVAKVYIPPDKRDLDDQSLDRFANEIKVTSAIRHPYVLPSLGSGTARVGAYTLPYYLMPQAATTLRSALGKVRDSEEIQRVSRLFLQACLGVSYLHARGVIHRDLKPENVLISREGDARIADLGIAHIDPDFVSVSLRTIAAEQLLNRDYYAPEQRFGKHSDVDARADIYALGCILYELFVGAPPVRRDSPPVQSVNPAFAALDPVIDKMTSYEPSGRYHDVDGAIVDAALALGWVAATVRGARRPEPADVREMRRLLRSSNGANRAAGVSLAVRLGAEALPTLHDLMGHGRREVRNSAAAALGQIGDERSLPYLVAGLHGNSKKASTFRPTTDTAASALCQYSVEIRTRILAELNEEIRPDQLIILVDGLDSSTAFAVVDDLQRRKTLLLDWSESVLSVLAVIDEAKAWPRIRREARHIEGWQMGRFMPLLSGEHQLEVIRDWMRRQSADAWDWDRIGRLLVQVPAPDRLLRPVIEEFYGRLDGYPGQTTRRTELVEIVVRRLQELTPD